MSLEATLWLVALLLVAAVFVATAIKLWPRRVDDPLCGTLTHDGLSWVGRIFLPSAGREIDVVFHGPRNEPPGEAERAAWRAFAEGYSALYPRAVEMLQQTAREAAGKRRRRDQDFVLRSVDIPRIKDAACWLHYRSARDFLDLDLELRNGIPQQAEAILLDGGEVPDAPLPPAPAGGDWTAVAEAGVVALPEDAEPILTRRAEIETALLTLAPLVCFIGGPLVMLLVLGDKAKQPVAPMIDEMTRGETWLVLGALAITLYGLWAALFRLGGTASRALCRRARDVVGRRRDRLVDPDDREARFVEVVPRADWYRQKLVEDAADVGFLKIDAERGTVLFEGGAERWAIRGEDIDDCDVEEIGRPGSTAMRQMIVLGVRNAAGCRERCFALRRGASTFRSRRRRGQAEEIRDAIDRLRGR